MKEMTDAELLAMPDSIRKAREYLSDRSTGFVAAPAYMHIERLAADLEDCWMALLKARHEAAELTKLAAAAARLLREAAHEVEGVQRIIGEVTWRP